MPYDLRTIIRAALNNSLTYEEAAAFGKCSLTTINRYRLMARERSISWDDVKGCGDTELDEKFNKGKGRSITKIHPDFAFLIQEFQKPSVTKLLLWEEYRAQTLKAGLSYSQFTAAWRDYEKAHKSSMRMLHPPGKCAFVDFSGKTMRYYDRDKSQYVEVQIFVGVLGHSLKTFAWATSNQTTEEFVSAHELMFEFFGGVTEIVVPDNLKAAVICYSKGQLNRQYEAFSDHYSFFVDPARPRRPQDKSAAENGVKMCQRWILARLRNVTFFSLEAINAQVAELTKQLNARIRPKAKISRDEKFETSERAFLKPLPSQRFEIADWTSSLKVPPDYHILIADRWYSVPYTLIGQHVYACYSARAVKIFRERARIATHERCFKPGHSTLPEHCHPNHRVYHENTQETHEAWAQTVGKATQQLVQALFKRSRPQLALPSCARLRELAGKFGFESLELGAQRALELGSPTLTTLKSLLQSRRFEQPLDNSDDEASLPAHENIRGRDYYQKG